MATAIAEPPHLTADMKALYLSTVASQWRRLAEQAARQRQAPADYLAQLVHLEVTGRRERRIQRRIQDARFPMLKTLDAFSFEAQPDLDRDAVLQQLARFDLVICDELADRRCATEIQSRLAPQVHALGGHLRGRRHHHRGHEGHQHRRLPHVSLSSQSVLPFRPILCRPGFWLRTGLSRPPGRCRCRRPLRPAPSSPRYLPSLVLSSSSSTVLELLSV